MVIIGLRAKRFLNSKAKQAEFPYRLSFNAKPLKQMKLFRYGVQLALLRSVVLEKVEAL